VPNTNFRMPKGIKLVRVNPQTGKLSQPSDETVIIEAIKPDYSFDTNKQRTIGYGEDEVILDTQSDGGVQVGGEY